jgi:hypothetical protein
MGPSKGLADVLRGLIDLVLLPVVVPLEAARVTVGADTAYGPETLPISFVRKP